MSSGLRGVYAALNSSFAGQVALVVLHIASDQTFIAAGRGPAADAELILGIGAGKTAAAHFHHFPPTAGELENAIQTVEDALFPVRSKLPEGARLFTTDAVIREIARIAGLADTPEITLSREAVEQTFERMASVAAGRPVVRSGLPEDPGFYASLLILREFLHHEGFAAITVRG